MADLEFDRVDRFTTGTVGPPGRRAFFIQAVEGARVVTLKMEKQQVTALADSLDGMLSDLPTTDTGAQIDLDLVEPIVAEWVVGAMGVAYDEDRDEILLVAEQVVDAEAESLDAPPFDGEPSDALEPADGSPESVRFRVSRPQAAAFVGHARDVVAAGRPPCIFCGQPRDPDGHRCPRMN